MDSIAPAVITDFVIESRILTRAFTDFTSASYACMKVRRSQILALMGPNGTGKSPA